MCALFVSVISVNPFDDSDAFSETISLFQSELDICSQRAEMKKGKQNRYLLRMEIILSHSNSWKFAGSKNLQVTSLVCLDCSIEL